MPLLPPRATISGTGVSSWHSCMSKAYCKWPVIIGIIITSVILLSILWCFVRCLCCGLSCCCDCFSCCSGGRRNRPPKYADPPPPPQGFYPQPPAPYQGGYAQPPSQPPVNREYSPAHQQPVYEPPQFATFDVSRNKSGQVNEDALPAMPSWENATSRKVLEEHDGDMEMGTLEPAQAQRVPMLNNQPHSPVAGGGYADSSSHALDNPYHQANTYNSPDQGSPHAHAPPSQPPYSAPQSQYPPTAQRQHSYTDQPAPQPYPPSAGTSMRYAPSSTAYEPQELGAAYGSRSPPPQQPSQYGARSSPPQQSQYGATPNGPYGSRSPPPQQEQYGSNPPPPQQQHYTSNAPAPSILQVGRKPVPNTWQDV